MQLTLALIAVEILLWRCSTQKIAMDSRFPASKNKKRKINNNRFLARTAQINYEKNPFITHTATAGFVL